MFSSSEKTIFTHRQLTTAIIRTPIIVAATTPLKEVIACMSGGRSHCALSETTPETNRLHNGARASCAIVISDQKAIGILTERDVVRLCATQQLQEDIPVAQVMSAPVLTLRESAFTDLFGAVHFLQQNHIRHLPLVDEQDHVVGLITDETLRQLLEPADLLRLRSVEEVMTATVVTALPTDSLLTIAQHIAQHRVSSIVIIEPTEQPETAPLPIGIVTERDLVQFQALALDFERYQAGQVMSHPVITVPHTENLVTIQQLMQRHLIRRLVVTGPRGELRGIVTQTNMLQAVSPLELYGLTALLKAKVQQLETEKLDLLADQNTRLEAQVAVRTAILQKKLEQEQIIGNLATQIRSSLSLQTILDTAVQQIHQVIGGDRINIWQFTPDYQCVVIAESTQLSESLMGQTIGDTCFQSRFAEVYRAGYVRIVPDVYSTTMADCHRELLVSLNVRAKVLVPLFCESQLWGLLSVSESHTARDWQEDEIELLRNISTHLMIAIQQASTHAQLQAELHKHQQTETQLRQNTARLKEAQRLAKLGHWELDLLQNTLLWSEEIFRIFEIDPQQFDASYEAFLALVHPEDRDLVNETFQQHIGDRLPYNLVHRLRMADGRIKYVHERCETLYDAAGVPQVSYGTIQDITEQREAEIRRDRTEASLRQVVEGTAALTGEAFFPALARCIAEALQVRYVFVAQAVPTGLQVLALLADGELRPPCLVPYEAAPCCVASMETGSCYHPQAVQNLYPENALFADLQVESYLGISLRNGTGEAIGNLCILHDQPLTEPDWAQTLLSIFAVRAGAELERLLTAQRLERFNTDLEEQVTERTQALAEREALLQDFLDNAHDLIQMVCIETGRFQFVNRAWRETLGYTAAEVNQLTLFDILAPDCVPHCQQVIAQMQAGALYEIEQVELTFIHKSGRAVLVEGNINCRYQVTEDGRRSPLSTRAIFRDITAKKEAELALRASETRYRQLIETAQEGIWIIDQKANHQFANDALLQMLQYTAPEMEGRSLFDFLPMDLHSHLQTLLERRESGIAEVNEVPFLRRDGSTLWALVSGSPIFDEAGQYTGAIAMVADITDRKIFEEAIQTENTFRRSILENLAEGLCVCREVPDYPYIQFTVWNPQMEVITGYTQTEINQLGWYQTLYPDPRVQAKAIARMQAMRLGDHILGEEWTIRHRDGSDRVLSMTTSLLQAPDGTTNVLAIMQDVTERRRIGQERKQLLQELAGFKLGLDQAAIVVITDAEGTINYVNQNFVEISGYSETELLGETHRLVNSGTHPPSFFADLWQTIQRGEVWRGEICNRAKGGQLYWVESTIVPFLDEQGRPERYLAIRFDITGQKQANLALQESQQFLETILDTVPLGIFWKDRDCRYLGANTKFLNYLSLNSLDDLVGKNDFELPWAEVDSGFYRAELARNVDNAIMETGESRMRVAEVVHPKDGFQLWLETNKLPLRNVLGDIVGILGTYQDVTDRYKAELKLKRQLAAIEAAVDGIAILQDGHYMYLNSSHVTMFGYGSAAELLGQSWRILYSEAELARFDREVFPVLQAQGSWTGEAIATRKDGSTFPEQLSLTFSEDGLLICVCQDITDRRAAEAELQRTNAELERATRLKDEFLANMSHELRTPLNAILGMTEALQDQIFGTITEKQANALQTVERSADHLLALINDILDVAKIESGQMTLDCRYVAVEELCASSLNFIQQQAQKKRIRIKTEIPRRLPDLFADEIRVRQALLNLLTNAVKFTPEGGAIALTVSTLSEGQAHYLRFTVQDTGIGIAPENISKLFQPFVQIDSALNRKYMGTGLGLALVRRIAELHGGRVGLTSELGQGSCFTLDFPYGAHVLPHQLPKSEATNQPLAAPATVAATIDTATVETIPLILLVEDNLANVMTISCYLRAKGYQVLCAQDGQEAIDIIMTQRPDVILMDIQMPGMDGLEAIQIIRQQDNQRQIPIIALTALAMEGDRQRCLDAGANDYFSKPVKLKELDAAIQKLLAPITPGNPNSPTDL